MQGARFVQTISGPLERNSKEVVETVWGVLEHAYKFFTRFADPKVTCLDSPATPLQALLLSNTAACFLPFPLLLKPGRHIVLNPRGPKPSFGRWALIIAASHLFLFKYTQ